MTITCCQLYHDALRQPRIAIRYSDGTEEDRAPTPSELHLLKRTPTEVDAIPTAPAGYRYELVRLATEQDAAPQVGHATPHAAEGHRGPHPVVALDGAPAVAAPWYAVRDSESYSSVRYKATLHPSLGEQEVWIAQNLSHSTAQVIADDHNLAHSSPQREKS